MTDNLAGELNGLSLDRSSIHGAKLDFSLLPNSNNNNCNLVTTTEKLNDSAYESISDMQESQNDEIKPVFSDALFHYSSSDEGFEGSPASFRTPPSTPIRKPKLTSKWKSPAKASSCAPYLIEASPIRIQRQKKKETHSPIVKIEKAEETKLDFISALAERNLGMIVEQIFGHCGDRELQMSSEVNREWRSFLTKEPFNQRRADYRRAKSIRQRDQNFNRNKVSPNWRAQKLRSAANHHNRIIPQTSPVTRSRLADDCALFVKPRIQHLKLVKRNLGLGEEMIYCPVCEYPATKSGDRGKCTMSKCNVTFCTKCKAVKCTNRNCQESRSRARTRKKLAKL